MSPSIEYFRGVRLVKTQLERLVRADVLRINESSEPFGMGAFYRYTTNPDWKIDLDMLYGQERRLAVDVWEIFYTAPCAGLTFIADVGSTVLSSRPEYIHEFTLIEFRK